MLKKAAAQATIKDLNDKLTVRLNKNVEDIEKLI